MTGAFRYTFQVIGFLKLEILAVANDVGPTRLFSLKQDFPTEWHKFTVSGEDSFKTLISKDHFPYIAQMGDIVLPDEEGNRFQLWKINETNSQLEPVPFESDDIVHNLDQLNSDERVGEFEIDKEVLANITDDVFLVVNYRIST